MEQLNKIELRGIVGNIRVIKVGDTEVARLSLATSLAYKDREGCPVIETTWHQVKAWKGSGMPDFHLIGKGSALHVTGRLKCQRYTASDGSERTAFEVVANRMSVIDEGGGALPCETS